jgi:hypothetical protein
LIIILFVVGPPRAWNGQRLGRAQADAQLANTALRTPCLPTQVSIASEDTATASHLSVLNSAGTIHEINHHSEGLLDPTLVMIRS